MSQLASATFRDHADPAVRELARVLELVENDHAVMRREHAAMTAMLMARDAMQTTITADTVSAITTWQDYGTETVMFTQPDGNVQVFALATSIPTAATGTTRRVAELRVGISLDGGSTFTFGDKNRAETDRSTAAIAGGGLTAFAFVEGEPTGDIVVKAQIEQLLGSAGDITWNDGSLFAEYVRMEMEEA